MKLRCKDSVGMVGKSRTKRKSDAVIPRVYSENLRTPEGNGGERENRGKG